jgi:hypothetical protein
MFTFIKNYLFGSPTEEEVVEVEQTSQALFDKIMDNFKKYPPSEWTGWKSSCDSFRREEFCLSYDRPQIPYTLFVSKFLSRPISIEGGVIVDGTCITLDEEHAKLLLQFLVDYKKKEKEATENAAWKTILKS